MDSLINILLLEDESLVRRGLAGLLSDQEGLHVAAAVASVYEALAVLDGAIGVDVIVADVMIGSEPGGLSMLDSRVPGYTPNRGITMNVQTGRHRLTGTYGPSPNLRLTPRQALANDIWDLRRIYRAQGLYTPIIRTGLRNTIALNRAAWPSAFNRFDKLLP
jgi:hypothetical protein